MKIIEVIVSPTGKIKLGNQRVFAGQSCRAASKFLETALGNKAAEQLTAEFYQSTATSEAVQGPALIRDATLSILKGK